MTFRTFALLAGLLGCGTTPNPASCLDDHCSDPARPFCDKDGAIGGVPNTCIAVGCTPGEFERCNGDAVLKCDAAGKNYEEVECEYGCSEDVGGCAACNTPACERHILPRYLPNVCNELTTESSASFTTQTIDTGTDANCTLIIPQPGAPEICVRRGEAFTIPANQTLTLNGTRVFALVADRDILVEGTVDVSGTGFVGGPGNTFTISGTTTGGAGFRHAGGAGGSASVDGGLANGGASAPNPSLGTILVAGRSSTQRSSPFFTVSNGGGGITIVSCRGTIKVTGTIDANGGGGRSAGTDTQMTPPMDFEPAGGGSGGYVALQGMQVLVSGGMFANGGGGGGGEVGAPMGGQKGQRSMAPAQGGPAAGGGIGGNGGTGTTPPSVGRKPSSFGFAGAGGGSSGFLQVFTAPDTVSDVGSANASPMIETFKNLSTNR